MCSSVMLDIFGVKGRVSFLEMEESFWDDIITL